MGKDISRVSCTFMFCDGGSCRKAGGEQAIREARAHLKNQGLWGEVHTIKTRCNGRCEDGPTWIVQPGNFWYKHLNAPKSIEIVKAHLSGEPPVADYLLYQPEWETVSSEKERPKEPVVFKLMEDEQLGRVHLARMGSSDQDLYPLFQYLFSRYEDVIIELPEKQPLELTHAPVVDYSEDFHVTISSDEVAIRLAIAPLPAQVAAQVEEEKIGRTEVIVCTGPGEYKRRGIRFRSRKSRDLLIIWFKEGANKSWEHVLKNYLNLASEVKL